MRVAAIKREHQRLAALAIVKNRPPPVSDLITVERDECVRVQVSKSVLGAMDISDISIHLNRSLHARQSEGGKSRWIEAAETLSDPRLGELCLHRRAQVWSRGEWDAFRAIDKL